MSVRLSESRLANLGAVEIHQAFDLYRAEFRRLTQCARSFFEQRDWLELRDLGSARLDLYRDAVNPTVERIRDLLQDRTQDRITWAGMKAVYSGLIAGRDDWELAETFFNSITRRIFATVGVDSAIEFVDTDFVNPPTPPHGCVYRAYERPADLECLFGQILTDYAHMAPYTDMAGNASRMAAVAREQLGKDAVERAEFLMPVFYRNKGAYLIGRLWAGGRLVPVAIALIHLSDGVTVDALLLDENELSIVFSFAHSYFLVDVDRPHELVAFLHSILPRKRLAELYISLGYHKHGKTELYRDLLECLEASGERFLRAPGERGMVMSVFTLPGYDLVVKVIKDRFAEPKRLTRGQVMSRYQLVFRHDRAGRLVDAQEFEHLDFPRERFAPELLDELQREAALTVGVRDDRVIIRHAYIERRVVPLDVYVRVADSAAARHAAIDFGFAIKDLAASNIFPGDFFLKNFGVTRHGRVVSYDYDELNLLTNLRFRPMPQPASDDEVLAAEPWFHVADTDVFPDEFRTFLRLPPGLDDVFNQAHSDLFELEFWTGIQKRLQMGEVLDVFAYSEARRLSTNGVSGIRPTPARSRDR